MECAEKRELLHEGDSAPEPAGFTEFLKLVSLGVPYENV
jgi:hypothetical protein